MTTHTVPPRADTLFCLRYAVRVLERHSNLWSRAGVFSKFVTIATGAGAVAAVISMSPLLSVATGVALALVQALDLALDPAERKARAHAARREYARLLACQAQHTDADLHSAYMAIVAEDDVQVWQRIKELSYNDVLREKGLDPADLYPNESTLLRWLT